MVVVGGEAELVVCACVRNQSMSALEMTSSTSQYRSLNLLPACCHLLTRPLPLHPPASRPPSPSAFVCGVLVACTPASTQKQRMLPSADPVSHM